MKNIGNWIKVEVIRCLQTKVIYFTYNIFGDTRKRKIIQLHLKCLFFFLRKCSISLELVGLWSVGNGVLDGHYFAKS